MGTKSEPSGELLGVDTEQWRAELERLNLGGKGEPGLTEKELIEQLGATRYGVRKMIDRLIIEGRCMKRDGRRVDTHGRAITVPVYQLLPADGKTE